MKRRMSGGPIIRAGLVLLLCLGMIACNQQDPIRGIWKHAVLGEYQAVKNMYVETYGKASTVPLPERRAISTACIDSLSAMGDDGAINALVDMLEKGLPLGFIIAAEINGSGNKRAKKRLIALAESASPRAMEGVVSGIGTSTPEETRVLCKLASHENPKVRSKALYRMPNHAKESTLELLRTTIRCCLDDPEPGPRRAAVTAYARLFKDEAIPAVRDAINDPDYDVREIGFQWLHLLPREEALAYLKRASESADFKERKLAARAANMEYEETIAICERLSDDPSDDVKWWLAYALRYPAPGKEHVLLKLAEDPSARVRAKAAVALYNRGSDDADETLKDLLKDPDDGVVDSAAYRISWKVDEDWRADLIDAVKRQSRSDHPSIRRMAAVRIGNTPLKELEDTLVALMSDHSPKVRAKAYTSLYMINPIRLRKLLGL